MHALKATALCAAAAVSLAGCEGENLFANADVILAGGLNALRAVEFEIENRNGDRIDLVAEGGRFDLTLDDAGNDFGEFQSTFQFRGSSIRASGTFEIDDGQIRFSDDPLQDNDGEIERSFDFNRTQDGIFMVDRGALFDVDGDGSREVATVRIRLESRD